MVSPRQRGGTFCSHDLLSALDPEEIESLKMLQGIANNCEHWKEVPKDAMEKMKVCCLEFRDYKLKGSRSTTKGLMADVHATGNRIETEVCFYCWFVYISFSKVFYS